MADSNVAEEALESLLKARLLISRVDNWCHGTFARTKFSRPVEYFDADAHCWCSAGALNKVGASERARSYLAEAAFELGARSFVEYNDSNPHPNVLKMWQNAIDKARNDTARNTSERSRPDRPARIVDTRRPSKGFPWDSD